MLTSDIISDINRLSYKKEILLFLITYRKGVVKELDMAKKLNLDIKVIKKYSNKLKLKLMINIVDSGGDIFYLAHKRFYKKHLVVCRKCKHLKREKIKIHGKSFKSLKCSVEKCKHNKCLKNYNATKLTKKVSHNVKRQQEYKTRDKYVDLPFDEWKENNFVIYIIEKYTREYPTVEFPYKKITIESIVKEMCIFFKRMAESEWRKFCKKHIDDIFKECEDSDNFYLKQFVDFDRIRKTVERNYKRQKLGYCKKFGLNCIYYMDNTCTLKRDGLKCDKKLRKTIIRKYNYGL